jgi:hypothetical protein
MRLSVQDHKQCLCHIIFYLFIKYLIDKLDVKRGKAAIAFRLWASRRQRISVDCRTPDHSQPTATLAAMTQSKSPHPLADAHLHRPSGNSQSTTHSFDKHSH